MLLELAGLKPVLTALTLPPAGPLLLMGLGWLFLRRFKILGLPLMLASAAALWILSCNATPVWLDQHLLPQTAHIDPANVTSFLRNERVQAIIVLGGGAESASREYGAAQPSGATIARMHYGVVLAKQTGLPLGFSGGQGHAASAQSDTEAAAVSRWLAQLSLPPLLWLEGSARDTRENAVFTATMLQKENINHIALVTHAWHMPRAKRAFEVAGLTVTPAPMSFTEPVGSSLLEWLPSADGLTHSRQILREWLGLIMGQ
jgi:uncharacterized SAM-binding protein YcdF (DUF218 family)